MQRAAEEYMNAKLVCTFYSLNNGGSSNSLQDLDPKGS